ncbi:MAG: hypothetical protein EBV19_09785, partial [Flavobacteriia bacterium]|nr:hypothetical protein [Flavobacteriia bacterium]
SGRCVQRLDYYDNNSGASPKEIPDSLLQQFSTKNGRKVIDGRGIEPDIEIIDSVMSSFTKALVRQHMIFHFATQYHSTHESIATPDKFKLSEEDYTRFIAFVQTQNFTFNSYESTLLDQLKKSLQEKNEYAKVSKNFEALQEGLTLPLSYYFAINNTEISALLASEIVGRFFYEKGKNQYGFRNNRVLTKALEVLNNDSEYRTLLHIK